MVGHFVFGAATDATQTKPRGCDSPPTKSVFCDWSRLSRHCHKTILVGVATVATNKEQFLVGLQQSRLSQIHA